MSIPKKMNDYKTSDVMVFEEPIGQNIKYLNTIKDNFDGVYDLIGKFKDKNYKQIEDKKTVLTLIKKRLNNKYNQFTYQSKNGGRLLPDGYSLCLMNKILRHSLVGNLCYDLDISNAHPTFLLWIAKHNDKPCKHLENYVNNRNEFLDTIQDYYDFNMEQSKDFILSLLFDNNKYIESKSPEYDFYQEILSLQNFVAETFKDVYKKSKKGPNQKGSCLSNFLQIIENKVCQCMIDICKKNSIKIYAPCFDGCLLDKKDVDSIGLNEFIKKIEIEIKDMLDIDIILKSKSMTLGINKELDDIDKKNDNVKKDISNFLSDEDLGIHIINKLQKEKIILYNEKSNELYVYNFKDCIYNLQEKDFLMTFISKYTYEIISNMELPENVKSLEEMIQGFKTTKRQKDILYQMKIRLPKDYEFIAENLNKTPYLYPIKNNKVIDFRTDTIRDRVQTDYFSFYINIDYNQDVDEQPIREWVSEYIIPKGKKMDDDDWSHVDSLLNMEGYKLTGENNLKVIQVNQGPPDGAKSTYSMKINEVSGKDKFCAMAHKKVVIDKKISSSHEAELFNLRYARIAFISELEDGEKPNEDFLKRVSGDDKYIPARKCGGKEQELLCIQSKFVINTNNMFSTSDNALLSRLMIFEFPNKFDRYNPELPKIKERIKNLDVASVLFKRAHLFYKNNMSIKWSKQVLESTKKLIKQIDPVKSFIEENISRTNNKNDKLHIGNTFLQFQNDFKDSDLAHHKIKFIKRIEEHFPGIERVSRIYWKGLIAIKPLEFD
jgi:phage/plasmid-associated DNA primase